MASQAGDAAHIISVSDRLDLAPSGRVWCIGSAGQCLRRKPLPASGEISLDRRIREKLQEKLRGLEYRQRARQEQRAARQKAYRIASMMREQGTLRGARKYLELKRIPYSES